MKLQMLLSKNHFTRTQSTFSFLWESKNALQVFVRSTLTTSGKKNGEHWGRHYFTCQPSILNSRWSWASCRRDEVIIAKVRLGHCLAACLFKVGSNSNNP